MVLLCFATTHLTYCWKRCDPLIQQKRQTWKQSPNLRFAVGYSAIVQWIVWARPWLNGCYYYSWWSVPDNGSYHNIPNPYLITSTRVDASHWRSCEAFVLIFPANRQLSTAKQSIKRQLMFFRMEAYFITKTFST